MIIELSKKEVEALKWSLDQAKIKIASPGGDYYSSILRIEKKIKKASGSPDGD